MPAEYFEARERALLGERYDTLYAAPQETAARGVTVSALRTTPEGFAARADFPLRPSPFCKAAFVVEQPDFKPGRHPYHHAGVFYSQEPSASSAAPLLGVKPGMRVLDLCAAPGGKSSQLAAALQGQGLLVSNEYVAARAEILKSNLERMGVSNAVVLNETPARIAAALPEFFDRVLVDAPCSGEGMFRKEPAALAQHCEALVKQCAELGADILDSAAAALAPGGELVYSTCTFAPEEDEGQVAAFLQRHPEFTLADVLGHVDYTFGSAGEANRTGGLPLDVSKVRRIWPCQGGEGHFMARLVKAGTPRALPAPGEYTPEEQLWLTAAAEAGKKAKGSKPQKAAKPADARSARRENTRSVLEHTAADQWKVLPSGLTVLVRPMPGYSGTHVIYATRFGSIDRDFRLGEREVHLPAGVAHFLEHKMFEDEDGDAFAKFAKTGANANAFTAFDRTCYLFTATEQLDESLDVLLGMVGHPYFTEQTIAKEQGIIGQEIKMYDDSPDWRLITGLCECLYHSHPIRSDIAGTVESIAEITPEMLYDCCKAFYAPGNMVLAAAGNTSMEQILAACARHGLMDERPAEKVERLLRPEPMTLAATEKTITMPIAKSCFGLGFKEEPLPFGDLRSEMLYELILCCICGGMSPLYRRLYDEGLTNPGFGGEVLRVDGCCCILFTGESDQPDTVRQLLLDEIERVRKEGVDREIFTLCKNEKYGQLIENLENVEDSASQMADFALAGQTVAQQITMLAGLTAEDADAALQHILRPERMAVMHIEPDGTAVEEDEEEETEE